MQKFLTAFLVIAGLSFAVPYGTANAQTETKAKAKTKAKATKKTKKTTKAKEQEPEIAVAGHVSSLYQCDLGDKLTVYKNVEDNSYVNLRWHNKMYRMSRKATTTGADRFENDHDGLVLISIPAKSMLFDSKKGRQLANECRNPEQKRMLASSKK